MKKLLRTSLILVLMLSNACTLLPNPIGPAAPIGRTPTHAPPATIAPAATVAASPTITIAPEPTIAPTNSPTSAPPSGVNLSLWPSQVNGSYVTLNGPTQVTAFAAVAVRVEFFTAPTGTGSTPQLEFADDNGADGWTWYWATPGGGSHLWAEAIDANGARVSSPVLLILIDEPVVVWVNYTRPTLDYLIAHPADWLVAETGPNHEVLFSPPNAEPFIVYFSISLDARSLEQIQQVYAQQYPNLPPEWVEFAGQRSLRYRFDAQRFELYAPLHHGVLRLASDRALLPEVHHMLNSFTVIVPIGTIPPPTPACETHTASVQVSPSAQVVQISQQLIVQVTLANQGCVTLGLPQYTLRVHAPQGQPLFNPPQPESIVHSLAVAPGQSDSVEFVLQAAQVGSGSLQAEVSFEVHQGYPGPAYWGSASSAPIDIAVTGNLKRPDADQPASGICDPAGDEVVVLNISADAPSPRCVKVTGNQRLQIFNTTAAAVHVQLAQFNVEIQPGQTQLLDASVGSYLAPGVHWQDVIGGNAPEIWLTP